MSYLDRTARAIRDAVPHDLLPVGEDLDQLFRIYAVLARAKGEATTASDVHDAWAAWMLGRNGEHRSIRPYEDLDSETQHEDILFLNAIRQVAAESD